jgi:hypothetical protein
MRHVPFESMDHMLDAITKRNVIPANVSIPYLAMQGLKALRAWILYRDTSGQGIHPGDCTAAAIVLWRSQIGRLENVSLDPPASATKPPFLANINDWQTFEQLFQTHLSQCRSHRCGAPLAYVIRPDSSVTPDALRAPNPDLDTDLIATATHRGADCDEDNRRVYNKLKPLVLKEGFSVKSFLM